MRAIRLEGWKKLNGLSIWIDYISHPPRRTRRGLPHLYLVRGPTHPERAGPCLPEILPIHPRQQNGRRPGSSLGQCVRGWGRGWQRPPLLPPPIKRGEEPWLVRHLRPGRGPRRARKVIDIDASIIRETKLERVATFTSKVSLFKEM